MTRMTRFAVALVATAGGLLAARSANAQDAGVTSPSCASLPNPVYVGGSSAFGPTLNAFAAKLAMENPPTTIIYQSSASCVGATDIAGSVALTGTNGVWFQSDGTQSPVNCTFDTSPKLDMAVADVFYASCGTQAPQPQPSGVGDFFGPVQAMEIIVPKNNTTGYLTAQEGQDIWGCSTVPATITTIEPTGVFVRGPTSGTQIITGAGIGLDPSAFVGNGTAQQVSSSGTMASTVGGYPTAHAGDLSAIGFLGADIFDAQHASSTAPLLALPFQAFGQTMAYNADSAPGVADRKNVRDGHYFLWGYEHLLANVDTSGVPTSAGAKKLIGLITGSMTDSSFDYVSLEGKAGTIPLCAMSVKKADDVPGYIQSYTPAGGTCNCAYLAASLGTAPSGCTACSSGDGGTTCSGGKTCQHGYCE